MSRPTGNEPRSANRKRHGKSQTIKKAAFADAPKDLASLIRGLYGRVASELGVDPSYVSRVARTERRSKAVEEALRRELNKIVENIHKRGRGARQKPAAKK